mgnify:CR=1 FL=1
MFTHNLPLKLKKRIIFMLTAFIVVASAKAQSTASLPAHVKGNTQALLPKVIIMGDANQSQFESALEVDYQKLLLTACGNDVSKASIAWNQLSLDMEAFGAAEKFDLDGLKVWVYVLFNSTGKMDHLAYYLKPGSRFIRPEEFGPFLEKFMAQYQLSVTATYNFSQYGSLVFPNPK